MHPTVEGTPVEYIPVVQSDSETQTPGVFVRMLSMFHILC